jgi:type II secretory pathway component GspD/PulD (secretin)
MKKYLLIITFLLLAPCFAGAQQMPQPLEPTTKVSTRQRQTNFCDPSFVGEPITFSATAQLRLDDLIYQINRRFGINFLIGDGVKDLPINIRSGALPWNVMLENQLYLSGVSRQCIGNNTILLVRSKQRKELDDDKFNNSELKTEFIKLKYLQPTSGGTVDLAGRSSGNNQSGGGGGGQCGSGGGGQSGGGGGQSGGCGNFEKLKYEIEKILGLNESKNVLVPSSSVESNDGSGSTFKEAVNVPRPGAVAVIPGRNIFVVRGTEEQLGLIKQFIALADRPPFQVIIKGLVYTANIDRLRDIGVQTSIVASTADGRTSGGIIGGPISGAGTIFDFSSLIGTVDFNVQASALQRNGIISIKARPFAIVLDGDPTELEVGRQIPVLTQGSVVGGNAGNLEFIGATNKLSVTPHVIDDDNGNPVAVNLELLLQSNEVDVSVISQGIPTVNERSIQSRMILSQDKTVILGGFTVDSTNDSVSKTPGLGDIPILGYLFKRKVRSDQINRLYFALQVSIVPYGDVLEPVKVPGATTEIPGVKPAITRIEEKIEKKDQ